LPLKTDIYEECDTKGIHELRTAIAKFHEREYKNLDPEKNILVTGGASVALFCLFMAFIE